MRKLTIGLLCVVALTVPGVPLGDLHWAEIALWICLAFFLAEWFLEKYIRPAGLSSLPIVADSRRKEPSATPALASSSMGK